MSTNLNNDKEQAWEKEPIAITLVWVAAFRGGADSQEGQVLESP